MASEEEDAEYKYYYYTTADGFSAHPSATTLISKNIGTYTGYIFEITANLTCENYNTTALVFLQQTGYKLD